MKKNIPIITVDQMRDIDLLAVQHGLLIMQMMEHAGMWSARLVASQYPNAKKITILCGPGNNGGNGIAMARFLKNWGYTPQLILTHPESQMKDVPMHHLAHVQQMDIPVTESSSEQSALFLKDTDVLIDAMIGYNLTGDPREPIATLIKQLNASPKPVIAIDNPSGLDMSTGKPTSHCIQADETITLALPKLPLYEKTAHEYVGRLFLVDLGIPDFIYLQLGIDIEPGLFKESSFFEI
jgi:NAD(P)H-hydrate epimerase